MLAYDFPLLSLTIEMLIFLFMLQIFVAVIWAFIDNFRRHDHSGWAKAGWALLILTVPLFGMIVYMIARPRMDVDPNRAVLEEQHVKVEEQHILAGGLR